MTKKFSIRSHIPPLYIELSHLISGDIDCGERALSAYSKDTSPYTVRPQAIVYPKNATDIKHCLTFCREYKIPLTVYGKGLSTSGAPLGEGIILDLTRYCNHIVQVDVAGNTVTVQAGATVAELIAKLSIWGMSLPVVTDTQRNETIGGIVATRSLTDTSFYHGSIREWIEGVTVVVDTGEEHHITDGITPSGRLLGIYQEIFPLLAKKSSLLRAHKPENSGDSTGYSVWNTSIGPRQLLDQLVGSEGTLGIITSVTFRMMPKKIHAQTIALAIQDNKLLPSCIAIAKHHGAEQLFLSDQTAALFAERFHPQLLPQLFSHARYILYVTFHDNDIKKLHANLLRFTRVLPLQEGAIYHLSQKDTAMIASYEAIRNLLEAYSHGSQKLISVADGCIIPQTHYASCLEAIDIALAKTGRIYTLCGFAGSGHVAVLALFDTHAASYENDIQLFTDTIITIVKDHSGGISAQSGDGIAKTPYLSYIYNEELCAFFSEIKAIWDPLLILNPGKKTTLTHGYAKQHLAR